MHTVQIADDVYAALQRVAVPFEEDINDVLRRVPDVPRNAKGNGHTRHPRPDETSMALPSGLVRWQSQTRNALMQLQHEGTVEQLEDGTYHFRGST